MRLSGTFNPTAQSRPNRKPSDNQKVRRSPPFSLRLSENERARLRAAAGGTPLGAFIKAKALGDGLPVRMRRTGLAVEDRKSLARALALLGQSRIASNLNQLAHAANVGVLPMTPETEAELAAALRDVRAIRRLLMAALGLKPEAAP